MGTHCSILALRNPWTEDPGRRCHGGTGYSPWGCKESDTTEQLTLSLLISEFTFSILFQHGSPHALTFPGHGWLQILCPLGPFNIQTHMSDDLFSFVFGKTVSVSTINTSVQFSRSVVSDSLRPHESQHARPPCPSPTPGVHSDSCPSSQWSNT